MGVAEGGEALMEPIPGMPEDRLYTCQEMATLLGIPRQRIYEAMQAGNLRFILRRGKGPVRVRKTTPRWVQEYREATARPWHEGDRLDHPWHRLPEDPLPPGVWEYPKEKR